METTTVQQIKKESIKLSKEVNGRFAVIVKTPYSQRKSTLGVQYWTKEMIATGTSKNTDKTTSTLIELL